MGDLGFGRTGAPTCTSPSAQGSRPPTASPASSSSYQILEPDTGVSAALSTADQTLGGVVDSLAIGEQGAPACPGSREYLEDAAVNGRLLGCEWRVRVLT